MRQSSHKIAATNSHTPAPSPLRPALSTLNHLPYGVAARVVAIGGEGPIARRLMEMGVVPGAPVCVIKCAPLGDPIEVRLRGYHLALRRTEAQTIAVVTGKQ